MTASRRSVVEECAPVLVSGDGVGDELGGARELGVVGVGDGGEAATGAQSFDEADVLAPATAGADDAELDGLGGPPPAGEKGGRCRPGSALRVSMESDETDQIPTGQATPTLV